jgi:hypothetical protein
MISTIIKVYFTFLPYELYQNANRYGNFGKSGIAIGLINSQNLFWMSNIIMTTIFFLKNNKYFYYTNFLLFLLCIYLYVYSFKQFYYLMKYLKYKDNTIYI